MISAHRYALILALVSLPAVASAQAAPTRYGSMNDYYRYTGLDLDFQGGGGWWAGGPGRPLGFGRVRTGILFARWPWCTAIGTTFEINNLSAATYGLQIEFLHIGGGFWAELGATIDGHARPGGLLSLGWSIFGVEGQVRGIDQPLSDRMADDGYGVAFVGKVRIPVGFLLYALTRK